VQPGELVGESPFDGLPPLSAHDEPPLARDVGLRMPVGMDWYFRKSPLSMRPGVADFTLSVSGPWSALAWVPAQAWTTAEVDLSRWTASSLTLRSCPNRAAQFLGGILARDLHTCLQITMHQAGHPDRTIRRYLDGARCRNAGGAPDPSRLTADPFKRPLTGRQAMRSGALDVQSPR
jgi:hypothetical protein